MEQTAKSESYVTVKDHKDRFPNTIKTRLINPSKPNIERAGKIILEEINHVLRYKTKLKQFRSTGEVINWFKTRDKRLKVSFIQFDVESFYPNISSDLIRKSLYWAGMFTLLTSADR